MAKASAEGLLLGEYSAKTGFRVLPLWRWMTEKVPPPCSPMSAFSLNQQENQQARCETPVLRIHGSLARPSDGLAPCDQHRKLAAEGLLPVVGRKVVEVGLGGGR